MIYYKRNENHKVLMQTKSEQSAKDYNLTQTCDDDGLEKGFDGQWYEKGYAPEEPAPTEEEQRQKREVAYTKEVDPITCHISRLADEEQTPEIEQQIAELKQERSAKVEEIKERYPYPVGEEDETSN